ncbi:ABC transporter ATP-binding protein [Neopusillimonas maritima]|uniref:ABC transporter ATP-binding protein n=1 Tax=Neopusillimonas maritima TaxID=2026239 RepID=A0ABX9MWG4_9BURK|nr:ABC transporter ATP-binding protein [Neopusillimonas maritima]RII83263.1 ABC transporter ATP-binding protein [Neopusillimonas maritima]
MEATPLLELQGLKKSYGALCVTDDVSLTVEKGGVYALIGPNGAGKTTLVGQLSGLVSSDAGRIHFMGRDITGLSTAERAQLGMGRSFQITSVFPTLSALENVALVVRAHAGLGFHFWKAAHHYTQAQQKAAHWLETVGLPHAGDGPCAELAHGELRQLELAMALAANPHLLVLDEPMAGLGPAESRQMIQLLAELKKDYGILLIEHDMDAVFSLADRISVLVSGRVVFSGSVDEVRESEVVQRAYLGGDDE